MKHNKSFLLIPVVAVVVVLASIATFYGGVYQPPNMPLPPLESVVQPIYQTRAFTDTPLVRKGLLVLDNAHWNSFEDEELSVFVDRVTARGFSVAFTGLSTGSREDELEEKLRLAQAYAVILPWRAFSDREVQIVKNFVNKGGRLLLVGDGARTHRLNGVSQAFGINFESDYLYNVKEHEVIFRNVYLKDFQADELTKGLQKVVFYAASSITSEGKSLIFSDEGTFSSMRERSGRFTAAVRAYEGRVVAISDVSFMIPPYNATYDNDQLIANIADFLTQGERDYRLEDFPFFLSEEVPVVALREELIPVAQAFKVAVGKTGRSVMMRSREDSLGDNVVIGLWADSPAVEYYLSSGGIAVRDTIRTPVSAELSKKGNALLYLYKTPGRKVLVMLGEDREGLEAMVSQLDSGEFRKSLVSPNLGIVFPGRGAARGKP
ncbi:MAG: hypothetical protein HY673_19870 [Chloroflexi bacterium]|nr:hypothetical protein [Chloroflexota bacterium]